MKKLYEESLKLIKELEIKNEEEYNKLVKSYLILSSESLKWISRTRNFNKIIRIAGKM